MNSQPNNRAIGVGGIRYEVNSFAAGRAGLSDFQRNYIREGDDVFNAQPNTEVRGAMSVAGSLGVGLVGLVDTFGGCGPVVEHDTYLRLKEQLIDRLVVCHGNLAGVYLPLHGAMASDRCDDIEGDLVTAVREVLGPERPIVVSQDLHGAPSKWLVEGCNALIGFKTCPHVDYELTGAKALRIAVDAAAGRCAPVAIRHSIPMLTPAEGHDTFRGPMSEPMRELQAAAEALGLLDASVFMCQPWLDATRSGWCLTAVYDNDRLDLAHAAAQLLSDHAERLWTIRASLRVEKLCISEAMDVLVAGDWTEPVLLADGGDSPSAGSTGDGTELLKALLEVADPRARLGVVTDPAAATRLHEVGVGGTTRVTLGSMVTPGFGIPISVEGVVVSLAEGRFISGYPAGPVDIGRTAALTVGATTIAVTERPAMMLDQQVYRHLGLDPTSYWAVQVKSAGGFRALWHEVSTSIISVDTRGPSDGNLARLPFRSAPCPLWPLPDANRCLPTVIGNNT